MDGRGKTRRVAIACQGGGSHTAFTAGTLKKMLEEGHERYDFVAFSGTSGGAVCALLAWYALIEHGKGEAGAREAGHLLDKFWVEDNAAKDPRRGCSTTGSSGGCAGRRRPASSSKVAPTPSPITGRTG